MEWTGTPKVLGAGNVQLVLLTLSICGLQFAWGIEQAYVTVYLTELGLSRSSISLIWLAGPMCGLVVQPLAGVLSDHCTSSLGRRRPFMIWGALLVAAGLLAFSHCKEVATCIGMEAAFTAVLAILVVDVTLNACQACCRALIVDVLPAGRQLAANGWAGRMSSGGHMLSYGLCSLNMDNFGFDSQLKGVCLISSLVLVTCVGISAASVKERVLVSSVSHSVSQRLTVAVTDIWRASVHLDRALAAVFKVQIYGWYSWFTFLFYGTAYAGYVWHHSSHSSPSADARARAGSRAFLIFSFSSTVFSVFLPTLRANIVNLWSSSYVIYAVAVLGTALRPSYPVVLLLYALVGIPWAMTLWAPFALTAERIHELPPLETPSNIVRDQEPIEARLDVEIASVSTDLSQIPTDHNDMSGVYLGIHNCAITLPQFVSTFGSYLVFRLLDAKSEDEFAIGVTLQIGAVAALLAALYAQGVKRERHSFRHSP